MRELPSPSEGTPWKDTIQYRARLDNGLEVCVLSSRRQPIVSTALCYRAGASQDHPELGGTAHFLEHMMFRGSQSYGPGRVDEITQSMGGSNNAFTSHDCAVYQFSFASDRWQVALALEADRMRGLRLAAEQLEAERSVILEEISLHEDDPWDSLEQEVFGALYGEHPYGASILGNRHTIAAHSADQLGEFHECFYTPDNAVLVVAGDVGPEAVRRVEQAFGDLGSSSPKGGDRRESPRFSRASRIRRSRGDLSRLLLALPGAAATEVDYAHLRLVAAILGAGRTSRLHRRLVDEDQLLVSVSVDITETLHRGALLVSAEVFPGVDEGGVEERILEELDGLVETAPGQEELERSKRLLLADWVFSHQQTHQRATTAAIALGLFGEHHLQRHLQQLEAASTEDVHRTAKVYLRPLDRGVTGWSEREGISR
jgi:zinc protease